MNKVILIGRLTKDVETRYSGETAIARYSLAVDRKFKREGEPTADFIIYNGNRVLIKKAQFEKYLDAAADLMISGCLFYVILFVCYIMSIM